jgi:hypothetical protein
MRVEYDCGVHERQSQAAALQGQRTRLGSIGPRAQRRQVIRWPGQQFQAVIIDTRAHGARLSAELTRCRAHDINEGVSKNSTVARSYPGAIGHIANVHGYRPLVRRCRDPIDECACIRSLLTGGRGVLIPRSQRGCFITEVAEPYECLLHLLECAATITFLRESIFEQQSYVAMSDTNRGSELMREHMQDVVDVNRHANAEPTTRTRWSWHAP